MYAALDVVFLVNLIWAWTDTVPCIILPRLVVADYLNLEFPLQCNVKKNNPPESVAFLNTNVCLWFSLQLYLFGPRQTFSHEQWYPPPGTQQRLRAGFFLYEGLASRTVA